MKQLYKRLGVWGGVIASILFLLPLTFSFTSCKNSDDDDDSPTYYTITIAEGITHGTVATDKTTAPAGDTVTLTLAADDGYQFDVLTVTDANDTAVATTAVTAGTTYTFTMPASGVTVSASFTETAATVNSRAVSEVTALITAIGTVEYTDESKRLIEAARTAYNALTSDQQALVPADTLAVLTTAETTYSQLKTTTTNQTAANDVIAKITAIGTVEYTTDCKTLIDTANTAYNALTEAQKALVTNYAVLIAALETYNAVDSVITKIAAIGTVEYTDESKRLIEAARSAYDALTSDQQALVADETLAVLTTAEGTYSQLEEEAAAAVTTPPTATSDVTAGSTTALVTAGVAEGGTMMYKVTAENTQPTSTEGFSATVPTAENLEADTYYLWYYVKADATHTDSEISTTAITVTVTEASPASSTNTQDYVWHDFDDPDKE